MAGEIRVLEDQLYEADYQNRKLIDRIEQLESRQARPPETKDPLQLYTPPMTTEERSPLPIADPQPREDASSRQAPDSQRRPSATEPEQAPDRDTTKEDPDEPAGEVPDALELPPPVPVPEVQEDDEPPGNLEPAPGGAEPPGMEDLQLPDIFDGVPVPPSEDNAADDKPRGQIELPIRSHSPIRFRPGFVFTVAFRGIIGSTTSGRA